MSTESAPAGTLLRHLCQRVTAQAASEYTDPELLQRFLASREEAAFAALMQRHARLVWAVCCHVLDQEQDREDAFQVTFVLLARKADSIRTRKAIGSWLYGVAYRTAMTTRRSSRRRRGHESRSGSRASPGEQPEASAALRDLQALLDDEVAQLPEKYRLPFVLCCLEGKTKGEAAQELGWKEGTVSSRLAQARQRLQERLVRRGVTLSATLSAGALTADAVAAPASVFATTLATVLNPAGLCGAGATRVAALLRETGKIMGLTRWQLGFVLVLATSLAAGAALVATQFVAEAPEQPQSPGKPEVPAEKKAPARQDVLGDALPGGALARLGSTRLQLGGSVYSVGFSPDGKYLAAAGHEPIRVWETATGKDVALLRGHSGYVTGVRFFPDGKTLVSAGHDGKLRIWDLATQREQRALTSNGQRVQSLAIAPDGKSLATGSLDSTVRVWEVKTGKTTLEKVDKGGSIDFLAFTGNGKYLAWGSPAQGLHIEDLSSGKAVAVTQPKFSTVQGLASSADGKFVAWAGRGAGIRLVEVATGKEVREIAKSVGNIRALAFSPDGKFLAASGYDLKIRTWEVESGKEARTMDGSMGYLMTLAYSPDGKQLAAAGPESLVPVWDTTSGKLLHEVVGHRAAVQAVAFAPDGQTVLTGSSDATLRLWDPATGKERSPALGSHAGPVVGLVVALDGKTVYSAGMDQTLLAWQLNADLPAEKGRTPLRRFTGIKWPGFQLDLSLSPDGKLLAATDNNAPAFFWDAATGKDIQPLVLPKEPRRGIAFSPDRQTVALRTREGVLGLWDLASGKERLRIGKKQHSGPFAFSADGRAILALDSELHLWEVATGRERWHIAVQPEVLPCLAVSPTGKLCAVGGADPVIRVLDMMTGLEAGRLAGHRGAIRALAFSPDGRRLVSGSVDATALVWDVTDIEKRLRRPDMELEARELAGLWKKLLDLDTAQAYKAMDTFAGSPTTTVPFLKNELTGLTWASDPKQVGRLIADLDSERFEVRENAGLDLEEIGPAAEPLLRKALEGSPSTEARVRIEVLLDRPKEASLPMKKVRVVRALEILEEIGTPVAREVVEGQAKRKDSDWLRREAETMLARWKR
jgi:RNA polymerase sigma factor (sigma-70 family)